MAMDEEYRAFIKESLISPIRSVLIVDDDYPTLDELLAAATSRAAKAVGEHGAEQVACEEAKPCQQAEAGSAALAAPLQVIAEAEAAAPSGRRKEWETSPEKMKAVIDHFRGLLLLVDVHDGSDIDAGTAKLVDRHLHQSDLLILDYHLDETDKGDKAIEIARAVAANDHFNMVVVNTRHKLSQVFEDMVLGLQKPLDRFDNEQRDEGEAAVAAVEDEQPDAADRIRTAIGARQYLRIVSGGPPVLRDAIQGKGIYADFKAAVDDVGIPAKDHRNVLIWAVSEFQGAKKAAMAQEEIGPLEWSETEPFWIRSDRLFMTFSDKAKATEPLEILLDALCSWAPPPSRLILAKFRAEMEAKGVSGETKAVSERLATAHWYLALLKAEDAGRRTLIEDSIGRHAEQLIDGVKSGVHAFADRLSSADRAVGAAGYTKRVAERFASAIDEIEDKKSSFAANAVACSKPPGGWHLRTGHVFEMNGFYWVCLTPICDMVPGQKRAGHRGEIGQRKPFIAAKLHLKKAGDYASIDVNSNNYLFLKVAGEVKVFSLLENAGSEEQPHWYMMYAEDGGKVTPGTPFPLSKLHDVDGALKVEQFEANLVSELRYEYAINLMQKLGISLTRVGLDFVA